MTNFSMRSPLTTVLKRCQRAGSLRGKHLIEKPEDGSKPGGYLGRTFQAQRNAPAKGFCPVCGWSEVEQKGKWKKSSSAPNLTALGGKHQLLVKDNLEFG